MWHGCCRLDAAPVSGGDTLRFPKFWEHRSAAPSGSYTTDVLNYLSSSVSGQALRGTAAAIEICAGVWQRGMATAEVTPMNGRTAALTPSVLGHIGRYLLRYGEVLFEIGVGPRGITLTPAQHWTVTGGVDPDSWMYECTFQSPSSSVTRTLPAGRVLHLMYAQSHSQPWVGIGPLSSAGLTQELVGQIETALVEEATTPRGYNLAVPDPKQASALTRDLRTSRGGLALVPSVASDAAWGQGIESKPGDDWVSKRFGMAPPPAMVQLRSRAELSVLAAAGVPVTILSVSDGTAKREDFRRYLHLTLEPVGRIVADQIGDALEVDDLHFDFSGIGAADIASKARAWGTLTKGGVSPEDAGAITGLPIDDAESAPPPGASSDD